MSCVTTTCGLGGWNGPLPGDPDNNLTLSATTVFSGIKVTWSYPSTNSHAVAHTILYRGITTEFAQAMEIAKVGGSSHLDVLNPVVETTYYYWIRMVSVNGTVADVVGPAAAIARPRSVDTLESLTGQIDAGVLAQSLKTQIDKITLNYHELTQEIQDRLASNTAITEAMAQIQAGLAEALAFVDQEITSRIDGDNALVTSINTVAALNAENLAAIVTEQTARVTADSAMASELGTIAAITNSNAAAILTEATTRADADSAMATTIASVNAATGTNAAAINNEITARTNADSALASQINTVQSTLGGNISSVQTSMQTQINSVTGELDAIYTAKVDVNGLVGGFGIYGTPTQVEAGFDVDRFWVGRTTNRVKPFIIDGGIVYMDIARIRDADITSAKIRDAAITNAKIGIAAVDTLSIAGEAVTIPRGAYATNTVAGHNISVLTLPAMTTTGGSVILNMYATGVITYDEGGNGYIQVSILRNGLALFNSYINGYSSNLSGTYIDTPSAGTHTYTMRISTQNGVVGERALTAIGCKR